MKIKRASLQMLPAQKLAFYRFAAQYFSPKLVNGGPFFQHPGFRVRHLYLPRRLDMLKLLAAIECFTEAILLTF